jgi:toxin YoeB
MIRQLSFLENFREGFAYKIRYSSAFKKEYSKFAKNITLFKKINTLILEVAQYPKIGRGEPEKLRSDGFPGREIWSRRINGGERIIYEINTVEFVVDLLICGGHYENLKRRLAGAYLENSSQKDAGLASGSAIQLSHNPSENSRDNEGDYGADCDGCDEL